MNSRIIILILTIFLLVIPYFVIRGYQNIILDQKNEIERLQSNSYQKERQISELNLTVDEIKTEREKGNIKIMKLDSILKKNNAKLKQLERMIATDIIIIEKDTIYLPGDTVYEVKTGLYKTNFSDNRGCIQIDGFILSTDSFPGIAITRKEAIINVYDIKINRRWWQFWKPKKQRIIDSNCGEVRVLEINNMNQ
jgi:hypothetical protein